MQEEAHNTYKQEQILKRQKTWRVSKLWKRQQHAKIEILGMLPTVELRIFCLPECYLMMDKEEYTKNYNYTLRLCVSVCVRKSVSHIKEKILILINSDQDG